MGQNHGGPRQITGRVQNEQAWQLIQQPVRVGPAQMRYRHRDQPARQLVGRRHPSALKQPVLVKGFAKIRRHIPRQQLPLDR